MHVGQGHGDCASSAHRVRVGAYVGIAGSKCGSARTVPAPPPPTPVSIRTHLIGGACVSHGGSQTRRPPLDENSYHSDSSLVTSYNNREDGFWPVLPGHPFKERRAVKFTALPIFMADPKFSPQRAGSISFLAQNSQDIMHVLIPTMGQPSIVHNRMTENLRRRRDHLELSKTCLESGSFLMCEKFEVLQSLGLSCGWNILTGGEKFIEGTSSIGGRGGGEEQRWDDRDRKSNHKQDANKRSPGNASPASTEN
ncbi:hypothetical protein B0H14DRAFT_2584399 [Mycena olivaceomarginata]|nr:hypothetical protein B0H14DRAFT_2584399 [Mycena olivaceomarginata]